MLFKSIKILTVLYHLAILQAMEQLLNQVEASYHVVELQMHVHLFHLQQLAHNKKDAPGLKAVLKMEKVFSIAQTAVRELRINVRLFLQIQLVLLRRDAHGALTQSAHM